MENQTRGTMTNQSNTLRFYRIREVIGDRKQGITGIIPVSRAAWYAGIKDGKYPKPVKLSERTAAWRTTDITGVTIPGVADLPEGGYFMGDLNQ
jgi:predicted DNA-binding transcriptional regulator AlpA